MEGHDLSEFGWDGLVIPSDLSVVSCPVPSWKDLKILRDPMNLNDESVYFTQKFFTGVSGKYVPAYIIGVLDDDNGGYASIYKGKRALFRPISKSHDGLVQLEKIHSFETVCIKQIPLNITFEEDRSPTPLREKYYDNEIQAVINEALIHALISKTLEAAGFPSKVPRLFEVVAKTTTLSPKSATEFDSLWMVMEYINGCTLQKFLNRNLMRRAPQHNETVLLDILIQLSYYLQILQSNLRFNHRDLKINNVFVRFHAKPDNWKQVLSYKDGYTCLQDIMIIDFGFSCIACESDSRSTQIGAGTWFKTEDECLKCGRDIAQFLYSLHATFPLKEYVSEELFEILYSSVMTEVNGKSINLFHGFDAHGNSLGESCPDSIPFNDGIYVFLRNKAIDIPGCAPYILLEKLYKYKCARRCEKI